MPQPLYRVFFRTLIVFFAFLPLFVAPALAATGAKGDDYLVKGVSVDIQGSSALDARDKAYVEARRQAWQQLTRRLMPKHADSLVVPQDKLIASAVKDFSIKNEKMTSRRYAGTVDIRFTPAAVKRVIQSAQIGAGLETEKDETLITGSDAAPEPSRRGEDVYVNTRRAAAASGRTTLVLPWYTVANRPMLWGGGNPWRAAWEEKNGLERNDAIILPVGDVDDMRIYSPAQPLSHGGDIDALMKRYQASQAMLAMAQPQDDGSVAVALYRYAGSVATPVGRFNIDASARDALGEAVAQSIAALSAMPSENAPAPVQVSVAPGSVSMPQGPAAPASGTYRTLARFSGLQEWVAMRQALNRVPGMGNISVHSISPSQANLEFDYKGDAGALMHAFSQNGLAISALPQGTQVAGGPGDVIPQFLLSMGRVY